MSTIELRPRDDQNSWNFLLSLLFLLVAFAAFECVRRSVGFPQSVPLFDAVLMALAAFRITRLVVYDKIFRWFRELFMAKRSVEKDGADWIELKPHPRGLRRTIHDLLRCPWCVGFWSSLAVVFAYLVFPWAYLIMLFLAVAGVSTLIQLLTNLIGWKAETLKLLAARQEGGESMNL